MAVLSLSPARAARPVTLTGKRWLLREDITVRKSAAYRERIFALFKAKI
jgi:hypothetical protein